MLLEPAGQEASVLLQQAAGQEASVLQLAVLQLRAWVLPTLAVLQLLCAWVLPLAVLQLRVWVLPLAVLELLRALVQCRP